MRILLKCPTRSRPQKVMDTLTRYVKLANHPEQIGVVVSCDDTDTTMSRNLVHEEIHRILGKTAYHKIFTSPNTSKIEACNANMNEIDWEWDIVVLVSDDMIPQLQGYDDVIRNHMMARFPDTDGILWFNDGYQEYKLNTLSIYGRKMYERLGCIYQPEYKSFFCDNEITDRCKGDLKDKSLYIPYCIIRHEHPGTGYLQNMDSLYNTNQKFIHQDLYTYLRRKQYSYHWSVLIPTIAGREEGLQQLLKSIADKVRRNAPELKYEVCLAFDNREASIGTKRQQLMKEAKGRYMSFIDDDDDITDEYIQDLWACIQGNYDVMCLRGTILQYKFIHSLDVKLTDFMATQSNPPVFQRPPNHLNPILTDLARLVTFKDMARGEDLDWAIRLSQFQLLQTQYVSDDSRIHYIYKIGGRTIHPNVIENQRKTTFMNAIQTPSVWGGSSVQQEPGLRLGPRGFVSK